MMGSMNDASTPRDLALELGVTQRAVRGYLRDRYGKLAPFVSRWHLNEEQAADVRGHFSRCRAQP